jgi:hypothetical protein
MRVEMWSCLECRGLEMQVGILRLLADQNLCVRQRNQGRRLQPGFLERVGSHLRLRRRTVHRHQELG